MIIALRSWMNYKEDELKVAKENSTVGDSQSVETSNKLAQIEEKIKNIIRLAEEF